MFVYKNLLEKELIKVNKNFLEKKRRKTWKMFCFAQLTTNRSIWKALLCDTLLCDIIRGRIIVYIRQMISALSVNFQ